MPANYGFNLDIFDERVEELLEKAIEEIGQDPSSLSVLMDRAIEKAKRVVSSQDLITSTIYLKAIIFEYAFRYISMALGQSKKWNDAKEKIRSYSSIFLVGAGLSFECGVPLTKHLGDLLKFCKADSYCDLRDNSRKCLRFKREFKRVCGMKPISDSHSLIALNFPKHIREIICLNWDDLIEKASRENDRAIPKVNVDANETLNGGGYLWKFHGDVEDITGDNIRGRGGWIFPDEAGYIFDCFSEYVKGAGLNTQFFVFVIVGYSEKDEEIYNKIIKCFEKEPPRPTFRIGLNLERLDDENYIVGTPDFILPKILPITTP